MVKLWCALGRHQWGPVVRFGPSEAWPSWKECDRCGDVRLTSPPLSRKERLALIAFGVLVVGGMLLIGFKNGWS